MWGVIFVYNNVEFQPIMDLNGFEQIFKAVSGLLRRCGAAEYHTPAHVCVYSTK